MRRESLDEWLPTVVQYGGVVLAFVLVGAAIAGHLQDAAPLGVLALGMILYKSVRSAAAPSTEKSGDDG